jgi:hypothetical protein
VRYGLIARAFMTFASASLLFATAQAAVGAAERDNCNSSDIVASFDITAVQQRFENACRFVSAVHAKALAAREFSIVGYADASDRPQITLSQLAERERTDIVLIARGFDDFALQRACQSYDLRQSFILRDRASIAESKPTLTLQQALRFSSSDAVLAGNFDARSRALIESASRRVTTAKTIQARSRLNQFVFRGAKIPSSRSAHVFRIDASESEFVAAYEQVHRAALANQAPKDLPCHLR